MRHMSTTRPAQTIVARLTAAALKQSPGSHSRQRELVRASLLAR
jgi:hypothetical protein